MKPFDFRVVNVAATSLMLSGYHQPVFLNMQVGGSYMGPPRDSKQAG